MTVGYIHDIGIVVQRKSSPEVDDNALVRMRMLAHLANAWIVEMNNFKTFITIVRFPFARRWPPAQNTALVITLEPRISVARYSIYLHPVKPTHSALGELLELRFQLRRVQVEVIHSPDPQDAQPRKPTASPVHQVAADRTEAVLHCGTRGRGLVLCPSG